MSLLDSLAAGFALVGNVEAFFMLFCGLIVGVVGGAIPSSMRAVIADALTRGIDVASGTHDRLADDPEFAALAAQSGARISDVRVPPPGLPVGKGVKRSGKRLLTVGTDCALGKKYTALALAQEMTSRGMDATFRARRAPVSSISSDSSVSFATETPSLVT